MIVTLEQKNVNSCPSNTIFLWSQYIYIFCTPEVQLKATNILVTKDNILHRKHIYLRKKIKVPFSSPMLRYFVTAPEPLDTTVCCKDQWLWNKYICTTVELFTEQKKTLQNRRTTFAKKKMIKNYKHYNYRKYRKCAPCCEPKLTFCSYSLQ